MVCVFEFMLFLLEDIITVRFTYRCTFNIDGEQMINFHFQILVMGSKLIYLCSFPRDNNKFGVHSNLDVKTAP